MTDTTPPPPSSFETELTRLLNRTSAENASNTPDFILAEYLLASLAAFNAGINARETWFGRVPLEVMDHIISPPPPEPPLP